MSLMPGWPGDPDKVEEARNNPGPAAGKGIEDVVEHYGQVIAGLDARPVVVGHSFGGLIAQRMLGTPAFVISDHMCENRPVARHPGSYQ